MNLDAIAPLSSAGGSPVLSVAARSFLPAFRLGTPVLLEDIGPPPLAKLHRGPFVLDENIRATKPEYMFGRVPAFRHPGELGTRKVDRWNVCAIEETGESGTRRVFVEERRSLLEASFEGTSSTRTRGCFER
jgi:hypothetical protein